MQTLTNSLPYDYSRCDPEHPDSFCAQCVRWAKLPGQTWGPWTSVIMSLEDSTSEHCRDTEAT